MLSDGADFHKTIDDCINFFEHDVEIFQQRMDNSTLSLDQKPFTEDLFQILLKQQYNMLTNNFLVY